MSQPVKARVLGISSRAAPSQGKARTVNPQKVVGPAAPTFRVGKKLFVYNATLEDGTHEFIDWEEPELISSARGKGRGKGR